MQTEVVVALLAGGTALLTAAVAAVGSGIAVARSSRAERLATREDQLREANAVVDRYRRPLLEAAVELKRRIGNIRGNDFLSYLGSSDHRAEIAELSTLYRVAAYLGWREALRRDLTYMDRGNDRDTRAVLTCLEDVTTQFSSDHLEAVDQGRLMLWKEEQRAIGGLMLAQAGAPDVVGFEGFAEQYEATFSRWLASFAADLHRPDVVRSRRLAALAESLSKLIERLDVDKLYEGRC